jgi:hypothetical protein
MRQEHEEEGTISFLDFLGISEDISRLQFLHGITLWWLDITQRDVT